MTLAVWRRKGIGPAFSQDAQRNVYYRVQDLWDYAERWKVDFDAMSPENRDQYIRERNLSHVDRVRAEAGETPTGNDCVEHEEVEVR
jgi:hypothetical protein